MCVCITSGGSLSLLGFFTVQVLEQLHGFPRHDDLLEDGFEEGHHGVLPAAGALVSSGAAAGRVTQPLLAVHRLGHTVQGVGGVPEVPVVHWDILVPDTHVDKVCTDCYTGSGLMFTLHAIKKYSDKIYTTVQFGFKWICILMRQ